MFDFNSKEANKPPVKTNGATPFFQSQPIGNKQIGSQEKKLGQMPVFPESLSAAIRKNFNEWAIIDEIKSPIVRGIAREYVDRPGGKLQIPNETVYDLYGKPLFNIGVQQPTEDRVFKALYSKIDLKKIGKGNTPNDWTWTWSDTPSYRPKTPDEKVKEVGKFGLDQAKDKLEEKLNKKYVEPITKPLIESSMKWIVEREIMTTATISLLTGVGEVIAVGMLVYSIADLLLSLGESVEKEQSPYQKKNNEIVEDVKAFLQRKKAAEDRKKKSSEPYKPEQPVTIKSDRLEPKRKFIPGVGFID